MGIDDAVATLGVIELFADFSAEQLRLLAFVAEDHVLDAGEVLYRAGEEARGGFVLCSGTLAASEDPTAPAGYSVRAPALVGEFGLMLSRPRGATLVARTRAELLFIPRTAFMKLLRSEPELAAAVADKLRVELARYLDAVIQAGSRLGRD